MAHVVIDSIRAHAEFPQNLVVEYRAWRTAAEKDAGLPPVKRDTHTQQLPQRKLLPVLNADGHVLLEDGSFADPKVLGAGDTRIVARLTTPNYRQFIRAAIERIVRATLGDARDATIPLADADSEGALVTVKPLEGVSFDV